MSHTAKPSIMYWSSSVHPLLVLCVTVMFSVQVVIADYRLEVRLVSYSNPHHRLSDDRRCDTNTKGGNCDNIFSFEINVGNGWEQLETFGTYRDNDNIMFEDTLRGGRANPLVFTGVQWRDVQLRVMVCDDDPHWCQLVLEEVVTIKLRQETTPLTIVSTTSKGGHSRTLQLSYQVVCLPDYYGPECSVFCIPRDDSIGHCTCDDFDGTRICLPDYYGPECSVHCVPGNDSSGHYTCNESDGTKICLPDYYGPECSVHCVPGNDSSGHYTCNETDGTKICLPDYYGPECPVYCVPRNDSSGHYTCDETDGTKVCMSGFGGENCTIENTDGRKHTQSSSGVDVAVGGAVAGISVLVILIVLVITAVWVVRKKYKEQVISTDGEEPHCNGLHNPMYTSHDIPTDRLAVRLDSSTRELVNPIYGDDVRAEEVTTNYEATYSFYNPETDATTNGGQCGNSYGSDLGGEYEYVAAPPQPANYEMPVKPNVAYPPIAVNDHK